MNEWMKREKRQKKAEEDFVRMLREKTPHVIDFRSSWSHSKEKISSDPRYSAVDSSSRRERLFRDYINELVSLQRDRLSFLSSFLLFLRPFPLF